jgi:hypothetical protein
MCVLELFIRSGLFRIDASFSPDTRTAERPLAVTNPFPIAHMRADFYLMLIAIGKVFVINVDGKSQHCFAASRRYGSHRSGQSLSQSYSPG